MKHKIIAKHELVNKPLDVLKQYYGYESFRHPQEEVINSILEGNDTLGYFPTSFGKSCCFIIPALCIEGLTLVISPLIALQQDQVADLERLNIPAALLNSEVGIKARRKLLQDLKDDKIKLLYLSPETFFGEAFEPFYEVIKDKVSFLAYDELHMTSQWSDFRPNYTKLQEIRDMFNCNIVGLTATAEERVKQDIYDHCGLDTSLIKEFQTSFDRPNLKYNIIPATVAISSHIVKILQKFKSTDQGIIYFNTRKGAEEIVKYLNIMGYSALCYHAGMKKKDKLEAQLALKDGKVNIICATSAFGMGIDADLKYVICANVPQSFEDFSQFGGRSGRRGDDAHIYLIYDPANLRTASWLIQQTTKNPARLKIKLDKLREFHKFCQSDKCIRKGLLNYFGEQYNKSNCGSCSVCLNKLTK